MFSILGALLTTTSIVGLVNVPSYSHDKELTIGLVTVFSVGLFGGISCIAKDVVNLV